MPLSAPDAAALLGELASVSLLWPTHTYMDRGEADAVAGCVVDALGPGARWWSNREDDSVSTVTGVSPGPADQAAVRRSSIHGYATRTS